MSTRFVGVDTAIGDDYTTYVVGKRPGRIRKFLRRIGLDRSKWEVKIIKSWSEPTSEGESNGL